jgi:mono/diheme cytochrome c family protein
LKLIADGGAMSPTPFERVTRLSAAVCVLVISLIVPLFVPSRAAAGDATSGAKIFKESCARCHGQAAKGDGPDLIKLQAATTPDDWTDAETNRGVADDLFVSIVTKGGKASGKSPVMPAFGDKLSTAQIQDLLAFFRSVAK